MRKTLRSRKSRVMAVTASAGVLAVIATGAFAYYANQTATANATTGSNQKITITSVTAPTGLIPGGQTKNIVVDLQNQTEETLPLGTVNVAIQAGWYVQSDPAKHICSASDFLLSPVVVNGALNSGQTYEVTPTIQMVNNDYDQANCKGVSVPLEVTLS